jgi:hypothetical protein
MLTNRKLRDAFGKNGWAGSHMQFCNNLPSNATRAIPV